MSVEEVVFRSGTKRVRPFSLSAEVLSRGCSVPLQRVVSDFGADIPFAQVPDKLKEHYGFELSASVIRRITERHARVFYEHPERAQATEEVNRNRVVIGEMDGGMVPVVITDPNAADKRKGKKLEWQEQKLCIAHQEGSKRICFGGTFSGDVDQAGKALYQCAVSAGFDKKTPLHAVGDGAQWISDQVEAKFGTHGRYLIDFYHVCEYLSAASASCSTEKEAWMETQKSLLKENKHRQVLINLLPYIEPPEINEQSAHVRCAYRYLSNRADQLDYKGAIEKGLPIGSGEIESAHRYVVQQRLKRPGAWWTPDNVDAMLAIRLARANKRWGDYWKAVLSGKIAA